MAEPPRRFPSLAHGQAGRLCRPRRQAGQVVWRCRRDGREFILPVLPDGRTLSTPAFFSRASLEARKARANRATADLAPIIAELQAAGNEWYGHFKSQQFVRVQCPVPWSVQILSAE
jgi:hypothetical protein